MRIGNYKVYFKKKGSYIVPLIFIVVMLLYLKETTSNFFSLSMIFVRLITFISIFFLLMIFREDMEIKKITSKKVPYEQELETKTSIVSITGDVGKKILFILLTASIFFVIEILGYAITAALYLIITMYILEIRNYKLIIFIPAFLITFLYFVFVVWLRVPLPTNIFGF